MTVEIVKVQIPLVGGVPGPDFCLVYAGHARKNMVQQTIPKAVRRALGSDYKGYFEATWVEADQFWDIGGRVGEHEW